MSVEGESKVQRCHRQVCCAFVHSDPSLFHDPLRYTRIASKNWVLASDPDYIANKFPGAPWSQLEGMFEWGRNQPFEIEVRAARKTFILLLSGLLWPAPFSSSTSSSFSVLSQVHKLRESWPRSLEGLDPRFQDRLLDVARAKLPGWYVRLFPPGQLATVADVIRVIADK